MPIESDYCGEFFSLTAASVEYEDGACDFTRVVASGANRWTVTTECEWPNAEYRVSIDGDVASISDTSGEEPYVLPICPTEPAS